MQEELCLYCVFHINLCYSSIPERQRHEVIQRCYWPLLELADECDMPVGIEISGHSLEWLNSLDPNWVTAFKQRLRDGRCQLIGSGDSQIIGPLVPAVINEKNLSLGQAAYQTYLQQRPSQALLNEQVYAGGLVSHYLKAGFNTIYMDCDNVSGNIERWQNEWRYLPHYARDAQGNRIRLTWTSSLMWRKCQQFVYREISHSEYLQFILSHRGSGRRALCWYGNDAEVIGYRPQQVSDPYHEHEWQRLIEMIRLVREQPGVAFICPAEVSRLYDQPMSGQVLCLQSPSNPLPVKKLPKYNISRWAVSGRGDLVLNTCCHRLLAALKARGGGTEQWRRLVRLWSSDYRTHITEHRWDALQQEIRQWYEWLNISQQSESPLQETRHLIRARDFQALGIFHHMDAEQQTLSLRTEHVLVQLNLRKGASLRSLAYPQHQWMPVMGSIALGFFRSPELAADYYTGHVIAETAHGPTRCTDLLPVQAKLAVNDGWLVVSVNQTTPLGMVEKQWWLSRLAPCLRYRVSFPGWQPVRGVLRVGHFTLLPHAFSDLYWHCHNGGYAPETFYLNQALSHGEPASRLVSCRSGVGATEGELSLGDNRRQVVMRWDPGACAAMPMLHHQPDRHQALTRVIFSLAELDDTSCGAAVLPLTVDISPA